MNIFENMTTIAKKTSRPLKYLVCFLLLFLREQTEATGQTSFIKVKMEGYAINLGGSVYYFQPISNGSLPFLESIDNTAFALGTINFDENNILLECSQDIGDTIMITIRDQQSKRLLNEQICKYFFCEVEVILFLFSPTDFVPTIKSKLSINYKNKEYNMEGWWVRNRVLKIIPKKKADVKALIEGYRNRHKEIPDWLVELGGSGG